MAFKYSGLREINRGRSSEPPLTFCTSRDAMTSPLFRRWFAALALGCAAVPAHASRQQTNPLAGNRSVRAQRLLPPLPDSAPRPEFWLPDGPISAMLIADGGLYIGGNFAHVAPFTGPFAVVDASTGIPSAAWPHSNGRINAVISDQQGGWYVAGLFTRVGSANRSNVAHVLADGRVGSFDSLVGAEVYALALNGSTLYVGGSFMVAGGQTRHRIAALDATTGAVLPWAPIPSPMSSSGERVTRIVVEGSAVYFSGYFDSPAAFPRRHLAAVQASNGSLIAGFNPAPDGAVFDFEVAGSTLYAVGNFTTIGGLARNRVAALDKATGAVGSLNLNVNGTVMAMALSGSTLYLGGAFSSVNGQSRACGAAVNLGTGALSSWNAQAGVPDQTSLQIDDLAVGNGSVYAAGSFQSVGGQRQWGVGRLDSTTGNALTWSGDAAGPDSTEVLSLALDGNRLACSGNFTTMGGAFRENVACLSVASGELMSWHPSVQGSVTSLLVTSSAVWIGGQLQSVNSIPRRSLARVDPITGATHPFDVAFFLPGDFVSALSLRGNTLFAGGSFHTSIPQQDNLIALDATTGAVTPGSTNVNGTVRQLLLSPDESRLYLAGSFSEVGNPVVTRNRLAAIDATNGAVLGWNPNPNQTVQTLRWGADRIFAAGDFSQIGGQPHRSLASMDPLTGAIDPGFSPDLKFSGTPVGASAAEWIDGTLIAGGGFDTVNGQPRQYLVALDPATGMALPWSPLVASGVAKLASGGGALAATAAQFTYASGELRPTLAVFGVQ